MFRLSTAVATALITMGGGLAATAEAQSGTSGYDRYNQGGGVEGQSTPSGDQPFAGVGGAGPLDTAPMERVPMAKKPPRDLPAVGELARPSATPTTPNASGTPPSSYGSSNRSGSGYGTTNTTTVDASYAEQLMEAALKPHPASGLAGRRVSLSQVVQSAGSRGEQSKLIGAYWDLCSATADYYLSLYEQAELERLASRSPSLSSPLRTAIVKLTTRRDTSLTAARATQLKLARLMRTSNQSLPLPGDLPLCSAYHTRYSQNFPSGGPQEAAELNKLLPLRHAELLDAANSVSAAEEFFDQVVQQAGGARDAESVVNALQFLALNRRAFVQIARDYNQRITRYTELAKPGELRTARLVAMLIKTPGLARRNDSGTTPPPGRRSGTAPPATFRSPLTGSSAPKLDAEVLPAGRFVEDVGAIQSMVEKVNPDESSVLVEQPKE